MFPTIIPTELLDLLDFPGVPYFDDISTVWEGQALPGVASIRALPAAIDSALSWDVEEIQSFVVWQSPEDRAILLLNSTTGHVELRLHDTPRQFEVAEHYLHWLGVLAR